jgi:hypothetical protein
MENIYHRVEKVKKEDPTLLYKNIGGKRVIFWLLNFVPLDTPQIRGEGK